MSDFDASGDSTYGQGAPSSLLQMTAGQMLREAREASGLHIAALAVSLKVPVRKIEALESDRLDELPDAVFARALASSVCRALRIDPQPVLALLPGRGAPLVSRHAMLNETIRSSSSSSAPSMARIFSRPAVLIVLLLMIAALVLWLLPATRLSSLMGSGSAPEVQPVVAAGAAPGAGNETVLPSEGPAPADGTTSTTAPTAANANASTGGSTAKVMPMIPAAPLGNVQSPVPAGQSGQTALSQGTTVAASTIMFTATGDSWVEVRDSRGTLGLQRTLKAGESVGAAGSLPLAVVVGRANATRVQVRGRDFDIAPFVRDNVARFEVR